MESVKKLIVWPTTVVLSIIFTICAVIYFSTSQNLARPAGFVEALEFSFDYPKQYGLSLLTGTISMIVLIMMLLLSVGSTVRLITGDFWEYTIRQAAVFVIINWIITVIIAIMRSYFVTYYLSLLAVPIVIFLGIYFYTKKINKQY
jgi:hypothetical protein